MAIQYLKKSPKTSSTDDTKTREIVDKTVAPTNLSVNLFPENFGINPFWANSSWSTETQTPEKLVFSDQIEQI